MIYVVLGYVLASLVFVLPYVVRYMRIRRIESIETGPKVQI
jgi:hypothetical protein